MGKKKFNIARKKSKDPEFIEFSKLQRGYLTEVRTRQQREFNEVLETIYEELGIVEKILKAPPGTYNLKMDFSGLDVRPVKPGKGKKPPEDLPPPLIPNEKGSKDN